MANDFFTGAQALPAGFFKSGIPSFTAPTFEVDPMSSAFSSGSILDTGASSPAKPGAESPFANAWFGGTMLLEGVNNLIRGWRGMDPVPGMAGNMINQYIAQQRDEDRLNKVLERIYPKETESALQAAMVPSMLKTDNPLRGIGGSASASYS